MEIALKPQTAIRSSNMATPPSRPNRFVRFLNWIDSGRIDVDQFRADVGQSHKLMLIQGQVIPVKARAVSLAPTDPAP